MKQNRTLTTNKIILLKLYATFSHHTLSYEILRRRKTLTVMTIKWNNCDCCQDQLFKHFNVYSKNVMIETILYSTT